MILWLLLAAVCLCGCGRKTASQTDALRQRYRDMQAAHMEAEITCHLETENRTFTVSCDWTPTGAGTTVTAPEALAGLTASVSGEDLTVSYDGAALSAGSLRDVAPANCLPWLLHAVAEGYLAEAGRETLDGADCLRLALDTTAAGGKDAVHRVAGRRRRAAVCRVYPGQPRGADGPAAVLYFRIKRGYHHGIYTAEDLGGDRPGRTGPQLSPPAAAYRAGRALSGRGKG